MKSTLSLILVATLLSGFNSVMANEAIVTDVASANALYAFDGDTNNTTIGKIVLRNSSAVSQAIPAINSANLINPDHITLDILNNTCDGAVLAPEASCAFDLRYSAPQTLIGNPGIKDHPIGIKLEANQVLPLDVYQVDPKHFLQIPDNTTGYTGLPSIATYNALYIDKADNIYLASTNGIAISADQGKSWRLFNRLNTPTLAEGSFTGSDIANIFADAQGNVYIAAEGSGGLTIGLKQADTGAYQFTNYVTGLGSASVSSVYVDKAGTVYAATAGGISIAQKPAGDAPYQFKNTAQGLLAGTSFHSIYVDDKGTIYLGTSKGVAIAKKPTDSDEYHFVNYQAGLGDVNVRNIFVDGHGTIYAATCNPSDPKIIDPVEKGGISIATQPAENAPYHFVNHESGLPSPCVESIYVDTAGTLYAGTKRGIAIAKKPVAGESYHFTVDNVGRDVTGIGLDSKHNLYAADKSSFYKASAPDETGRYVFTMSQGLLSDGLTDIYVDKQHTLYLGGISGIFIAKQQFSNSAYTFTSIPFWSLTKLTVDDTGTLYAATSDGIAIAPKPTKTATYQFTQYRDGLESPIVNNLFVDSNGTVYAATNMGIAIASKPLANAAYHFISYRDGLENPRVESVFVDSRGDVYAATAAGVAVANQPLPGAAYHFTNFKAGLAANEEVHDLWVDSAATIYAATGMGWRSPAGGIAIAKKLSVTSAYHFSTYNDGLKDRRVTAIALDKNGTIYAAAGTDLAIASKPAAGQEYYFDNYLGKKWMLHPLIQSLYLDSTGLLYVASVSGLFYTSVSISN